MINVNTLTCDVRILVIVYRKKHCKHRNPCGFYYSYPRHEVSHCFLLPIYIKQKLCEKIGHLGLAHNKAKCLFLIRIIFSNDIATGIL